MFGKICKIKVKLGLGILTIGFFGSAACVLAEPLITETTLPDNFGKIDRVSVPSQVSQKALNLPAPPVIEASSYVLVDFLSNKIIIEKDREKKVEPASLTKMMTMYVVDHELKKGKLKHEDKVTISEHAWRMDGSRMFVDVNSQVAVGDLIKGVIIQSGNDASVALAEHIAGSEALFAEMMNAYAKQLGMQHSHFVNATGLPDPQHYTSATDMAILAKAIIRDFPETYKIYAEKSFKYKNILQHNRNRLLWRNPLVDGIKTGHTDAAGFCLVSSGQKENMRLIAVVLGATSDNSRTEESNKLLSYGFRFFETRKLYQKHQNLQTAKIWMGKHNTLELGAAEDIYVTLPQGTEPARLVAKLNLPKSLEAPRKQGEAVGHLEISLDQKIIATHPIVALNNIEKAGWFGRSWDYLRMKVQAWWG
ncbi:MAG: D-alanyl-D-alanine carboxypeptidase family protein [Gammaproteobacteria bacterium]